jgi:chemotaxis protein methyltransferase CheR
MTTNETSFFRDRHPIDAIEPHVLPGMIGRNRSRKRMRVWSAACSTGQEAYSFAMLWRDWAAGHPEWTVEIIGTDLSEDVIERARSGEYKQIEVNRGLPAPLLVRYFERRGARWHLAPEIRRMADFQVLNLLDPWPPWEPFDLVFLRNVLIYFPDEVRGPLCSRLIESVAPNGYIITGSAETFPADDRVERVQFGRTVCYRKRAPEEEL